MIISHRYRYVFVELPRTGSTAVADELRQNYDGLRVMAKHATYQDFLGKATEDEKRYFAFSGIRNPLDDAVSRYFKLRTDHNLRYSHPVKSKYAVGIKRAEMMLREDPTASSLPKAKRRSIVDRLENGKFRFVQAGADFPTFFMRYYHVPYDSWSRLSHADFDFVIRFENLSEDFATVLAMIGVEPKRPLPMINKTAEKGEDFWRYYTPETIPRAKRVFGPFMERWGYALPEEWGEYRVPRLHRAAFQALAVPRVAYWRYLRGRI